MTGFPKLRAYVAGLLPEQEIDRFKVSGYLLSEAPGAPDGKAYVKAVEYVQSFLDPLSEALADGDLWKIEHAENRFLTALDELEAVCLFTPDGRLQ